MRVSSLPKAVTWKRTGQYLKPRPLVSRANALPLSHTGSRMGWRESQRIRENIPWGFKLMLRNSSRNGSRCRRIWKNIAGLLWESSCIWLLWMTVLTSLLLTVFYYQLTDLLLFLHILCYITYSLLQLSWVLVLSLDCCTSGDGIRLETFLWRTGDDGMAVLGRNRSETRPG